MFEFNVKYSGSKGNLYTLSDGSTEILIDPGVPIKRIKKALDFRLSKYSGAICSHEHKDHSMGCGGVMQNAVDLYCNAATASSLGLSGHRLSIIEPMLQIDIGTFKILPFPVPHDVDCMGFLIKGNGGKLLFFIDCSYCPYNFNGITHIAIGINYDKRMLTDNVDNGSLDPGLAERIAQSHMSLDTALDFFKAQDLSCVEAISILHCSTHNLNKDKAVDAIQRLTGKLVLI